jgi:hypothetical protein
MILVYFSVGYTEQIVHVARAHQLEKANQELELYKASVAL